MQSSSFCLKYSDISTSITATTASSAAGSWVDGRTFATWNVNLRSIVGPEIWDKYSKFVVRLNSVSHTAATGYNLSVYDTSMIMRISGLRFANSCYNFMTQSQSNYHDLFLMYVEPGVARSFYLGQHVGRFNINKSSDNVQISIEMVRQHDGARVQTTATILPHMCFMFDVIPVE